MTDQHLPHALRILARDIHCEDGIATQCIREAADEIDRLRLTDAERAAVEWALKEAVWSYNPDCGEHPATLRGLLERMK
jgi:hypothetical protein